MSQLYPPYIQGIIPAFYGDTIKIPFEMNPAVSWSEIVGFVLKIKNIYTNEDIGIINIQLNDTNKKDIQQNKILNFKGFISSVDFNKLTEEEQKKSNNIVLITGLGYKFQLAYKGKDEVIGYYSTVGVAKYTNKPTIIIDSLIENQNNTQIINNLNKQIFIGKYINEDVTEKVYSYRFDIYDQKNHLVLSSGQILHNNEDGTQLINIDGNKIQCIDQFLLQKELEYYASYKIQYSVKTINGLEAHSPKYTIVAAPAIEPDINAIPQANLNTENGYVEITFNQHIQPTLTGKFLLVRASDKDNYKEWNTMANYIFNVQVTKDWSYKDFTVEHGVTYKYAFCQYNVKKDDENIINIVSNRRESDEVKVEFDSMFLYDGERQLKINFNPKVSSFKINVLESKTDTIGGQFPYFFRNGNVKYREFPISGLISYWSDNDELFVKKEDLGIAESLDKRSSTQDMSGIRFVKTPTINLVSYNFDAEREFKEQTLEFLTNGKPKLFRSAAEGSFIVRLMNTSLSPNDTLGRMLHTFNSTAYEIDELNYDNLVKYNFVNIKKQQNQKLYGWETIDLKDNNIAQDINLLTRMAYSISCEDIPEGTTLTIGKTDIIIGKTWQYKPKGFIEPFDILKIKFEDNTEPQGLITYSYQILGDTIFDKYKEIKNEDIVIEFSDVNGNHNLSEDAKDNILDNIIYDSIEQNVIKYKYVLHNFEFIKFEKQEIMEETSQPIIDIENNIYLQDYEIYIDYNDKNSNTIDDNNKIIVNIERSGQWFAENLAPASSIKLGRGVKAIIAAHRTKIIYEEGYNLNEESSIK